MCGVIISLIYVYRCLLSVNLKSCFIGKVDYHFSYHMLGLFHSHMISIFWKLKHRNRSKKIVEIFNSLDLSSRIRSLLFSLKFD